MWDMEVSARKGWWVFCNWMKAHCEGWVKCDTIVYDGHSFHHTTLPYARPAYKKVKKINAWKLAILTGDGLIYQWLLMTKYPSLILLFSSTFYYLCLKFKNGSYVYYYMLWCMIYLWFIIKICAIDWGVVVWEGAL